MCLWHKVSSKAACFDYLLMVDNAAGKMHNEKLVVFVGPDQIVESQNICTTDPNGSVLLKIPKTGKAIETSDPISVPGLLTRTAKQFPNTPALAVKDPNGKWQTITYK